MNEKIYKLVKEQEQHVPKVTAKRKTASPLQLLPLDKENSKWLQLDKITRKRARECSKSNNFQRILTEVYVIDSLTERYERDMTKNFKSTATA